MADDNYSRTTGSQWRSRVFIYDEHQDPSSDYMKACIQRGQRQGLWWWHWVLGYWYYKCAYCRKRPIYVVDFSRSYIEPAYLQIEHVNPKVQADTPDNSIWNLVPACPSCNMSKGGRTPEEWLSKEDYECFDSLFMRSLDKYPKEVVGMPDFSIWQPWEAERG